MQGRAFVHRHVITFVTLNLILRVVNARVMRVPFVVCVSRVHLNDRAAHITCFGVPAHVITHFKFRGHVKRSSRQWRSRSSAFGVSLALNGFAANNCLGEEGCIALSIAFVAAEILRRREGLTARGIALTFGLLHGFGFASTEQGGFASTHRSGRAAFFNLGIEVGQLFVSSLSKLCGHIRIGMSEFPPRSLFGILMVCLSRGTDCTNISGLLERLFVDASPDDSRWREPH
jgi:hypothetical protein